jgi:hypothetical protein
MISRDYQHNYYRRHTLNTELFEDINVKEVKEEEYITAFNIEYSTDDQKIIGVMRMLVTGGELIKKVDFKTVKRVSSMLLSQRLSRDQIKSNAKALAKLDLSFELIDNTGRLEYDGEAHLSRKTLIALVGHQTPIVSNATKVAIHIGDSLMKVNLVEDSEVEDGTIKMYTSNVKITTNSLLNGLLVEEDITNNTYSATKPIKSNKVKFTNEEVKKIIAYSLVGGTRLHQVIKQGITENKLVTTQHAQSRVFSDLNFGLSDDVDIKELLKKMIVKKYFIDEFNEILYRSI